MRKLLLFAAGGLIDSRVRSSGEIEFPYDDEERAIVATARRMRMYEREYRFRFVSREVDSKDDHPRSPEPISVELIAEECRRAPEKGIVATINYGQRMLDVAEAIAQYNLRKVIVLVGANLPAQVNLSNAEVNCAYAIAAAQMISVPGVYIAFSGRICPWHTCTKSTFSDPGIYSPESADLEEVFA